MTDLPLGQLASAIGWISPAWVLVVLLGALWTGIATAVVPPPASRFPKILIGAIVGAALGQWLGQEMEHPVLMLGDVHVVAVSLGSVLALGIVRRLAA